MRIKLKCPKCKFRHTVTKEYLQKYGEAALVVGVVRKWKLWCVK